jgi:hypothetical protein
VNVRRRAQVLLLVSLVAWEAWEGARSFAHPWGDLGDGVYSDHFSHMNVARAFPRVGIDIWRLPVDRMFRPLTAEEERSLPADLASGGSWSGGSYFVPGWRLDKPLVLGWSHDPRLYPPGHLLLVAPVAVLYHVTDLPFAAATRLLLMLFILGAHLAFWVILDDATRSPPRSPRLYWLGFAASYALVVFWTLNGFFDGVVLAPLALSTRDLGRRRPLSALVWYCVAAFLHFRAYFFAPLAIAAAVALVRERAWRRFRVADWAALAFTAILGLSSLASFALVWSALKARPPENFVNLSAPHPVVLPAFLIAVALVARVLWVERARFDVALCLWLAFMTIFYRYFCPWHAILAFLPWLFVPLPAAGNPARIRAARLGFVVMGYLLTLV